MGLVPLVDPPTSFLDVLGQSWRSAAKHTDFTHLRAVRSERLKQPLSGEGGQDRGRTSGWTSCRELKKDRNGGRPKWVTDRRPVKRLRLHTFWKRRSHTYCKKGNIRDGKYAVLTMAWGWQWRSHQHGGAQVKLLRHLGDVSVDRDELLGVRLLHLPDDVRHPLELTLRSRHPDEVNLQNAGRKVRALQEMRTLSGNRGNQAPSCT